MNSKPLALFLVVLVWSSVFGYIAYSALSRIVDNMHTIDVEFKSVDELLNGSR